MADREWTADCVADHFEEAFGVVLATMGRVEDEWHTLVRAGPDLERHLEIGGGATHRIGRQRVLSVMEMTVPPSRGPVQSVAASRMAPRLKRVTIL